ncbi:hypothetical protein ACFL5G_03095 [Candidatus Margulisiibacteriota bacterium]
MKLTLDDCLLKIKNTDARFCMNYLALVGRIKEEIYLAYGPR